MRRCIPLYPYPKPWKGPLKTHVSAVANLKSFDLNVHIRTSRIFGSLYSSCIPWVKTFWVKFMPSWNGRLAVSWRRQVDPPLPPLPSGFSDQSQSSSSSPPLQTNLVSPPLFFLLTQKLISGQKHFPLRQSDYWWTGWGKPETVQAEWGSGSGGVYDSCWSDSVAASLTALQTAFLDMFYQTFCSIFPFFVK